MKRESTRIELKLNDDQLQVLNNIAKKECKLHNENKPVKPQKVIYALLCAMQDNEELCELAMRDYWNALRLL